MMHIYEKLMPGMEEDIVTINRKAYGVEPHDEHIRIATQFPGQISGIGANGRVQCYADIWRLRKAAFDAMARGEIWENDITRRDIDFSNPFGLYVASIAADPASKKSLNLMLVGNCSGRIHGHPHVIATPVTKTGRHLLRLMNFKERPVFFGDQEYALTPQLFEKK